MRKLVFDYGEGSNRIALDKAKLLSVFFLVIFLVSVEKFSIIVSIKSQAYIRY